MLPDDEGLLRVENSRLVEACEPDAKRKISFRGVSQSAHYQFLQLRSYKPIASPLDQVAST
jgi:hypothetical protein